jgi:tetratricopeptide (TPR) repeat protein/glycosyltransferase involved in cell wall biosynthesis
MTNGVLQGETLYAEGKIEEAEKQFLDLLESKPNNKEALNNLGVIAFGRSKPGRAADYFSKAIKSDPFYLEAIFNYCNLLRATNNMHRGLPILEVAANKYPENEEVKTLINQARLSRQAAEVVSPPVEPELIPEASNKVLPVESDRWGKESDTDVCVEPVEPALQEKDGNNVRRHLNQALESDPFDKGAHDRLAEILKEVDLSNLENKPEYAWLYLIHAFMADSLEQKDAALLPKIVFSLTDIRIERLIDVLMAKKRPDSEQTILFLLQAVKHISIDLADKLGEWMDEVDLFRTYRDTVEMQICLKCSDDDVARRIARRESAHRPPSYVVPGFETYPRRLTEDVPPDDPFMRLVPDSAPSKKHGLRVLVISDFNIAGQHARLMRSLNKYTNHMARCVIFQDDYLSYDRDVLIRDQEGNISEKYMQEAAELIRGADFFHIGRQLLPIKGIKWEKYISPRNAVFQYHGSHLRNNGPAIAEFHAKYGFEAITYADWSVYKKLPTSFYHLPCFLDIDKLPSKEIEFTGKLRLCHAPASANYRRNKRSDIIIGTMNRLAAEDPQVEAVVIENVPNRKCLELKSECHIHLASLLMAFGLNCLESAAMGLVPVTTLDNFTRFIFHDTPVVHATKNNVYEVTRKLISDRVRLKELSEKCRAWARSKFDARTVVKQYTYLYDLVYNGLSVDYPEVFRD